MFDLMKTKYGKKWRTKQLCGAMVTEHAMGYHLKGCKVCSNRDWSTIPLPQRLLYFNKELAAGRNTSYSNEQNHYAVESESDANLISSETVNGNHAPCIDIDIPSRLLESKTPGHYHLYFDVELSKSDYFKLLEVMTEVGLVEVGYYEASLKKGASFVRTQEMAIMDSLGRKNEE